MPARAVTLPLLVFAVLLVRASAFPLLNEVERYVAEVGPSLIDIFSSTSKLVEQKIRHVQKKAEDHGPLLAKEVVETIFEVPGYEKQDPQMRIHHEDHAEILEVLLNSTEGINDTATSTTQPQTRGIEAAANITGAKLNGTWAVKYGWLDSGGLLDADFSNLSIIALLQVSMEAGQHALVAVDRCQARMGRPRLRFNNSWFSYIINHFAAQIEDYVQDSVGDFICNLITRISDAPVSFN